LVSPDLEPISQSISISADKGKYSFFTAAIPQHFVVRHIFVRLMVCISEVMVISRYRNNLEHFSQGQVGVVFQAQDATVLSSSLFYKRVGGQLFSICHLERPISHKCFVLRRGLGIVVAQHQLLVTSLSISRPFSLTFSV
jgi:hypothetical protein